RPVPCARWPFSRSLGSFRNRVLPFAAAPVPVRVLVLEPVGAGGHDDLVALLFGQAKAAEHATLVVAAAAGAAAVGAPTRLGALARHQLVGRKVGEIIERLDPG